MIRGVLRIFVVLSSSISLVELATISSTTVKFRDEQTAIKADSNSTFVLETPSSNANNTLPGSQSGIETVTESCTCVPFEQCLKIDPPVEDELISIGLLRCDIPKICCKPSNLYSNTDQHSSPTPTISSIPNPWPEASVCGKRKKLSKTFGITDPNDPTETIFGEFPWMAGVMKVATNGIETDKRLICGASIISPTVILAAAHCVSGKNISEIKVRVGEYDISGAKIEEALHQQRDISSITVHPNYNSKVRHNDVALLNVKEPFNFTDHISPICTALMNRSWEVPNQYDPSSCLVTGWRKNSLNGVQRTTLKKVDLFIVPKDQCQNELRQTKLGQYFQLHTSFVCAGIQKGFDTCADDGGGPLVCALRNDPNRYIQVGIASWRIGCGNGIPEAYASLEANMEWIIREFYNLTISGGLIS